MTGGNASFNLTLGGTAELLAQYATSKISQKLAANPTASLTYGVDDGELNLVVRQKRPLQAGSDETLNLYDGSLYTILRETAPFRNLRWAVIWVESGGDEDGVTIGDAASNAHLLGMTGTTPMQTIYPDGLPFCAGSPAGFAVTNSLKNVKIANNGAVLVNYGIALLGSNVANPAAGSWMIPGFIFHV